MKLNLKKDVFRPVVRRIKSQCDSNGLRDFLRETYPRERYPRGMPATAGFVDWFGEQVKAELGDLVEGLYRRSQLRLSDADATMFHLIAAADLRLAYLREGATRYCNNADYPNFAGCLFLGNGSNKSKINELSRGEFELIAEPEIKENGRIWIVGLLAKRKK